MASLITRLLSRFKSHKAGSSRSRHRQRSRKLGVEQMEMRRLLAGDLGAIAGNVYTDLTDNGFDVADTAIVGTPIYLYQDGGNGNLESTGGVQAGDDVFIGTVNTDASGNYRFDDLGPGKYFVEQDVTAGKLQRPAELFKEVDIDDAMSTGVETLSIDDFDTTATTPDPLSAAPASQASDQVSTATDETLGDERDILVNNSTPAGPGANPLDVSISGGIVSISPGPGTTGNVIVSYDGIDGSPDTLDHTTLGPIDLTANDGTAFHFLVGSEAGNTLTIDVYSGDGNFSSTTVPLAVTAGGVATDDLIIRFADINTNTGTGADFTAVTAIRFQVDVASGADAQVNFMRVVAPNVSTANMANLDPMSLGNLVFNDSNNNGVLDAGEQGISGVDVELYEDTNANGSYDDGVDTAVGTPQTTDGNGNYLFDNLFPGEYIVLIPQSEFGAGNPLFGFVTSTGNDPAPDPDIGVIDGDDNGSAIVGVGVATAAITLASGSEPTNDGDTDTNSDLTIDFGFAPTIDLAVTKTASVATVAAGNQLTYTIEVTNAGDATSNNVLIVDDLPDLAPDALTIDSVTASGGGVVTQTANSNGEIEVRYASLTAAQTETITVVVTVPAGAAAAAAVTNTATVSGDGVETDNTNNTDDADVAIERQAVLTLTKSDTPDPIVVGGTLTYEILVTNTGPSTATNVVVSDTLPTGLTFVSTSTTAGTSGEASGVITANVGDLAPNASATVTVVTTVLSTFAGSTIPNTATAVADEATQVTANAETTINPQVDLSITKDDDVDPVNRGGQLTYTLVVSNAGPSGATNVEVVDTLPADVTFVSATGGTVTAPGVGESDVTVNVGDIASGGSATVTITVNVSASAAASFTNNAIVRSTESTNGFDTDTSNNSVSESTAAQSLIDLAITKTDSVDPVKPGESFVYTLVVTNNGPSDATLVRVTDNLPDGIRITSATTDVGTVTIPASAQDNTAANNDDLIVDVGNLANAATATITVNATVLPGSTGTLSNVASVASTDTSLTETVTSNNTATAETTLTPEIDLRITKTDSVDPALAGNSLTYTLLVTNDGPSTATNVNLSDTLPSGVTFTSATTSQGTVSHNSGTVTGTLGTLAPGASATVTVLVGINPATRGTITNTATVTATQTDADTSNNSATADTTVNGSIDLAITKADSVDPVAAGGSLTYTIIVTNNGPSNATNVVVSDSLPTGLSFASGSSTVGSVSNNGNAVTANVGTLAPGATATVTVNTTVASSATGTISNTATVTGTETDTNTANNSATQQTTLNPPRSISGKVYVDVNRNGVFDGTDTGIAGVLVSLTGVDNQNANISRQATTDAQGNYTFDNLFPGTYRLVETQPSGLIDGQANVGTGASGAVAGVNQIDTIQLSGDSDAVAFNFGEIRDISKRSFLAST